MLVVSGLKKRYGATVAVENVSFTVPTGSSFGLLGPNGAGKTTTISIIAGTIDADEGEVLLDGVKLSNKNPDAKRRIGYVPQELALYENLSARANLEFFGALYDLFGDQLKNSIKVVLEVVGLTERAHEPVRGYSGGMKRRLNMAVGLLHDPELLIFDEPTVGVDPQSRNAIFECLEGLCKRGKTLLYTTHYMEEVERLCQYAAILDHGNVVAEGPLDSLRSSQTNKNLVTIELDRELFLVPGAEIPGAVAWTQDGKSLKLETLNMGASLAESLQWLSQEGVAVQSVQSERSSLEKVFLELTGRNLRD